MEKGDAELANPAMGHRQKTNAIMGTIVSVSGFTIEFGSWEIKPDVNPRSKSTDIVRRVPKIRQQIKAQKTDDHNRKIIKRSQIQSIMAKTVSRCEGLSDLLDDRLRNILAKRVKFSDTYSLMPMQSAPGISAMLVVHHLAQGLMKRWLRRSICFSVNFCHNWSPRNMPVGQSIFGSLSMNHSANLSSSNVRITKSINVLRKYEISTHFIHIVCTFAILCDLIFFADYYLKITRIMIYAPFFIFRGTGSDPNSFLNIVARITTPSSTRANCQYLDKNREITGVGSRHFSIHSL
jgi:hypothetical protein